MTEEQVSKLEEYAAELETLSMLVSEFAKKARDEINKQYEEPEEKIIPTEKQVLNPYDIKSVARAVYGREL